MINHTHFYEWERFTLLSTLRYVPRHLHSGSSSPWLSALLIGGQSTPPPPWRLKDVVVVCVAVGRWGIRKLRVSTICTSPPQSSIWLKHGYISLIRLWPALPTETCEPTAEFISSSLAPTCTRTSICLLRLRFSPVSSHPLLFKNTTLCSLNVNYISVSFIRLCTLSLPPSFLHSLSRCPHRRAWLFIRGNSKGNGRRSRSVSCPFPNINPIAATTACWYSKNRVYNWHAHGQKLNHLDEPKLKVTSSLWRVWYLEIYGGNSSIKWSHIRLQHSLFHLSSL